MLITTAKKLLSTKLQLSNETGKRPVELCKLKVKDLDNDTKIIHPRSAKHGAPRQLKISDQLLTLLNEHIKKHNLQPDNYILGGKPEKYSKLPTNQNNTIKKTQRQINTKNQTVRHKIRLLHENDRPLPIRPIQGNVLNRTQAPNNHRKILPNQKIPTRLPKRGI